MFRVSDKLRQLGFKIDTSDGYASFNYQGEYIRVPDGSFMEYGENGLFTMTPEPYGDIAFTKNIELRSNDYWDILECVKALMVKCLVDGRSASRPAMVRIRYNTILATLKYD